MNFGGVQEKCEACGKTVYSNERLAINSKIFHNTCLRCDECQCKLKAGNYTSINDKYYCKPHFKALFLLKGNYADGFGGEKPQDIWAKQKSGGTEPGDPLGTSHTRTQSDVSTDSAGGSTAGAGNVARRMSNFVAPASAAEPAADLASIRASLKPSAHTRGLSELSETAASSGGDDPKSPYMTSVHEPVEEEMASGRAKSDTVSSDSLAGAPNVNALKSRFLAEESAAAAAAPAPRPSTAPAGGEFAGGNVKISSPAVEHLRKHSMADSVNSGMDSPGGLKEEIETLRDAKQSLEDTCERQMSSIDLLTSQLEKEKTLREEQANAGKILEAELNKGKDRLATIEAEIQKIRSQLESEKSRRTKAETDLIAEKDRLKSEQDRLSGVDSESEKLRKDLSAEMDRREQAEAELEAERSSLKSLEAELKQREATIQSLKPLREKVDQLEAAVKERDSELKRANDGANQLRKKLEEQVAANAMMEMQVEELQNKDGGDMAEMSQKVEEFDRQNAALMKRLTEEREQSKGLLRQLDAAKQAAAHGNDADEALARENAALKKKLADEVETSKALQRQLDLARMERSTSVASSNGAATVTPGRAAGSSVSSLPGRDDESHPLAQVRRLRQQVEQMRLQMPKTASKPTPGSRSTGGGDRTDEAGRRHTEVGGTRLNFDDETTGQRSRAATRGV